jgi:hypothetical protein
MPPFSWLVDGMNTGRLPISKEGLRLDSLQDLDFDEMWLGFGSGGRMGITR